jgi:hypothetical protein
MNILNDVNAFLLTKITPYSTIYLDAFPSDAGEEIMARNDPSQAVETRHMDGARVGVFQFSYYAKSQSSDTARQQLEAIIAALDFKELTTITGATAIRLDAATTPAFVERRESGAFIFVTGLRLEYYVGG